MSHQGSIVLVVQLANGNLPVDFDDGFKQERRKKSSGPSTRTTWSITFGDRGYQIGVAGVTSLRWDLAMDFLSPARQLFCLVVELQPQPAT